MVTLLPTATPTETEDDVPALIIGSGFGGAVTALRLGESGIRTMVLEQGRRWQSTSAPFSRNLPPDGRSTWLRNKTILPFGPEFSIQKYTGVLDRVDYPNMKVYRGIAVGGGSIVYGGISIEPPEELFYEVFPRGVSYQELHPYYDRVRDMLGISTVPADIEKASHYEYARVFAKHAANAGLEAISIGAGSGLGYNSFRNRRYDTPLCYHWRERCTGAIAITKTVWIEIICRWLKRQAM